MTSVHPSAGPASDLLRDVEHAHRHTGAALDDPAQTPLAAVTWGSSHVAAVTRVLHPLACRTLPDGRERVRAQPVVDRRLQQALWELDRRLTGDVHLARAPVPELEERVREALTEHERAEDALVAALRDVLDPDEQAALGERLADCLLRAPTRPHPDTGHGRLLTGAGFRVSGLVDRVRDGLDSRDVPTPHRVPTPRRLGRWGAYFLGVPYDRR